MIYYWHEKIMNAIIALVTFIDVVYLFARKLIKSVQRKQKIRTKTRISVAKEHI